MNEQYLCVGKTYCKEKGIISLTSWPARIHTAGLTIYSLLKMCPGYHIVLCLSREEFPHMLEDLPDDIRLMALSGFIEILWVSRNTRAFKKVLYTMDKYGNVPVISADDDLIYTKNYADIMYNAWYGSNYQIINWIGNVINSGQGTLFAPGSMLLNIIPKLNAIPLISFDSAVIAMINKYHIPVKYLSNARCTIQHNNANPINMARYDSHAQHELIASLARIL